MANSEQISIYDKLAQVMSGYRQTQITGPVMKKQSYESLRSKLDALQNKSGDESWSLIWEMVDHYLNDGVKTAHPLYFNQLWAGQSEAALIGSVIEVLANTSMYTFEVAPMATAIEDKMRDVFAKKQGLDDWISQVTTGGSNSNFLAVLLALQKRFPDYTKKGIVSTSTPRVYISEEAHYSCDKAMMMAGRGAFDPIEDLAYIAQSNNCWLHVDGAWGGSLVYASKDQGFLKGLNQADSFSWDAHKMLGLPLMCALIFTKDKDAFNKTFRLGNTSYIFHEGEKGHDLGPTSLQCGRRVDFFKMWLEYLFYGDEGFTKRVDHFLNLSALAEKRILDEPSLELQAERWINNICFRSRPEGLTEGDKLNEFNQAVRDDLKDSGNALVNQAYLGKDLTIRLIISNKDVTEENIMTFFDLWLKQAKDTEDQWKSQGKI